MKALSRRHLLAALGCSACTQRKRAGQASLWFTYGGKNRQVLEKLVRRFNHSQTRYSIHPVFQGDYFEGLAKLRTAIFAGAAPALSHVVGEVVPYLAAAGALEPLNEFRRIATLDVVYELGQYGSWIDGDKKPLLTLPFNRSTPIAYLNGDLFKKHGLDAPKTWDELVEVSRKLSDANGKRFGFGCPIDWWFWCALVGQAGGQVIETDGRISLGDRAGEKALSLWKKLVDENLMKPPPGRDYNAWEQTNQDFLAGRTAMIWTSTAFLRYLEESAPFPVVAAPLPAQKQAAVFTGGTHWILLKNAPELEKPAAKAFLRFMHEPAQAMEWATSTGYMPVTRRAIVELERRKFYKRNPNYRVALDQLKVAMPWPWSKALFRVQREIVQPRLEGAVLAKKDPARLLAEARSLAETER